MQISFIEVDGEECFDLLRGGAPLSVELLGKEPHASGAAQLRLRTLEDAAYALRLGLRASQRGVLAPRTHTILTLSVRTHGVDGNEQSEQTLPTSGEKEARLVLVDLASGDLHAAHRYHRSNVPQTGAGRSLAVLGACVAARAEGAHRGVPWGESKLSLLLRDVFSGEFCTAVLGCCGAAEADAQNTISTLHFLLHASRLSNRVRVPQPPLEALLHRLRVLDERLALHQQRWLEGKPHVAQTGKRARVVGSLNAPATGGAEDLGPQHEAECFRELAAQLGVVNQQRADQAAQLRAVIRDLRAAVGEAGRQRRCLPWPEGPSVAGLSGAHDLTHKLEQADQVTRALEEWLREASEAHSSLVQCVVR
jgi:hypothetical protein